VGRRVLRATAPSRCKRWHVRAEASSRTTITKWNAEGWEDLPLSTIAAGFAKCDLNLCEPTIDDDDPDCTVDDAPYNDDQARPQWDYCIFIPPKGTRGRAGHYGILSNHGAVNQHQSQRRIRRLNARTGQFKYFIIPGQH